MRVKCWLKKSVDIARKKARSQRRKQLKKTGNRIGCGFPGSVVRFDYFTPLLFCRPYTIIIFTTTSRGLSSGSGQIMKRKKAFSFLTGLCGGGSNYHHSTNNSSLTMGLLSAFFILVLLSSALEGAWAGRKDELFRQ